MLAIFKREFKSLFWNITGWLFIGITLALFGLYFFVYNLSYGYPYISYSLSAIAFLFMVTVPILTMRVLAEEKHAKTRPFALDGTGVCRKDRTWQVLGTCPCLYDLYRRYLCGTIGTYDLW